MIEQNTDIKCSCGAGVSNEAFEALREMFDNFIRNDFQAMIRQYEQAYSQLQEKIKTLNLDLARKNTELEKSLAQREALEREMVQVKTMAALGEMSATVVHEIRNPIGAMGMWAGMLERDLDPQDQRRKTLGKITDGLAKLNKIASNLLVYTRPITTEFRRVRLDELLEEIADFTEIEIARLGRDITVSKDFADGGELYVMADPEKIHQAIMNLCLNAVQAMGESGELCVGLNADAIGGPDGRRKYVVFTITDTGSGIAEEDLEKIFDPFFTTKGDGTGLGLAIVKKIIESHGGVIDVISELNTGTRVSCYLPIAAGHQQ